MLSSYRDIDYVGIEDRKLYETAIGVYLDGLKGRSKFAAQLSVLNKRVQDLKSGFYSAEALKFDARVRESREAPEKLTDLLAYLAKYHDEHSPQPTRLGSLFKTLENETVKDPAAEAEVKRIAQYAHKAAPGAALNGLVQDYRTGRISVAAFACGIRELLTASGKEMPEMSQTLRPKISDHEVLVTMKGETFARELDALLAKVRARLLVTPEAATLGEIDARLLLIEKLVKFELSRSDWDALVAYNAQRAAHGHGTRSINLLANEFEELNRAVMSDVFPEFYKLASRREVVFLEKIRELLDAKHSPVCAIAGGFHTAGLAAKLKEQGIPYVVISPAIREVPKDDRYREHMQGNVSWRSYFKPKDGRIDLYDAFARATAERLLRPESVKRGSVSEPDARRLTLTAREWRDDIIRKLAAEGRVAEHSKYTRYIDQAAAEHSEGFQAIKTKWSARLEKFIERLQTLGRNGQITEAKIAKLLTQPANQTPYAVNLVPGMSVPVSFARAPGKRGDGTNPAAAVPLVAGISSPKSDTSVRSETRDGRRAGKSRDVASERVEARESGDDGNEMDAIRLQTVRIIAEEFRQGALPLLERFRETTLELRKRYTGGADYSDVIDDWNRAGEAVNKYFSRFVVNDLLKNTASGCPTSIRTSLPTGPVPRRGFYLSNTLSHTIRYGLLSYGKRPDLTRINYVYNSIPLAIRRLEVLSHQPAFEPEYLHDPLFTELKLFEDHPPPDLPLREYLGDLAYLEQFIGRRLSRELKEFGNVARRDERAFLMSALLFKVRSLNKNTARVIRIVEKQASESGDPMVVKKEADEKISRMRRNLELYENLQPLIKPLFGPESPDPAFVQRLISGLGRALDDSLELLKILREDRLRGQSMLYGIHVAEKKRYAAWHKEDEERGARMIRDNDTRAASPDAATLLAAAGASDGKIPANRQFAGAGAVERPLRVSVVIGATLGDDALTDQLRHYLAAPGSSKIQKQIFVAVDLRDRELHPKRFETLRQLIEGVDPRVSGFRIQLVTGSGMRGTSEAVKNGITVSTGEAVILADERAPLSDGVFESLVAPLARGHSEVVYDVSGLYTVVKARTLKEVKLDGRIFPIKDEIKAKLKRLAYLSTEVSVLPAEETARFRKPLVERVRAAVTGLVVSILPSKDFYRGQYELEKSMEAMAELPRLPEGQKRKVSVVISSRSGKRFFPHDEEEEGQDALRIKVRQLETLFALNPSYDWELVIVDDASRNGETGRRVAKKANDLFPEYTASGRIRVLFSQNGNSQKGGGIVFGMKDALSLGADHVVYTDVDLSSNLLLIGSLLRRIVAGGAGIAIGSREHPRARVVGKSGFRKLSSIVYNRIARSILPIGPIADTQSGLKAFSRETALATVDEVKDVTMSFDTEFLLLAREKGFRVEEVPIFWKDSQVGTSISVFMQMFRMIEGLLGQRLRMLARSRDRAGTSAGITISRTLTRFAIVTVRTLQGFLRISGISGKRIGTVLRRGRPRFGKRTDATLVSDLSAVARSIVGDAVRVLDQFRRRKTGLETKMKTETGTENRTVVTERMKRSRVYCPGNPEVVPEHFVIAEEKMSGEIARRNRENEGSDLYGSSTRSTGPGNSSSRTVTFTPFR